MVRLHIFKKAYEVVDIIVGLVGFEFLFENTSYVVFVESPHIDFSCIIGFSTHFNPHSIKEFLYLSKDLELHPYFYLESTSMPYAKISLSKKNAIYFEDLTVWLNPFTYKQMWALLHGETDSYQELLVSMNQIVELLNL